MKTGIMLLKATLIITVFAGLPHLVAQINGQTETEAISYYDQAEGGDPQSGETAVNNLTTGDDQDPSAVTKSEEGFEHPLSGYWYTSYEELEVGVTYLFRQEKETVKAYSIEIYDKDGNKMEDNTLAMTVTSFEGNKGAASYFITWEDEKYEVECELKLSGDKLEVSYSYYGHEGKEVWEKVTK